MLRISQQVSIPDNEIEITAIRAQGAGGQKPVSTHKPFADLQTLLKDKK